MNLSERQNQILNTMIVTIDGPAGSGKSTTASLLAKRLGMICLDTGAMYRAITCSVLEKGIDPGNETAVTEVASKAVLELGIVDGIPQFFLDGMETESRIRTPEVSGAVSPISRYRGVREAMVRIQRRIGKKGGIVAEGRDTGTTVFPFAHVKIFLVADIEARASRRVEQMRAAGIGQDLGRTMENIKERDRIDSGREHSPLRKPAGAIPVDTSRMTIEQQVGIIEKAVVSEAERLDALTVRPDEKNPMTVKSASWTVSRAIVLLFFRLMYGMRVIGGENLNFRENFIFTSNHISYYDPPLVGCAVNREIWFMSKSELFRNRFFAWLITKYHSIPVRRGEADRKSIKLISEKLNQGYSILMFPEGTRSRTGRIGDLKQGFGMIAFNTGKSVCPILISGANDLTGCFLRRRRLDVHIGMPIRINQGIDDEDRRNDYRTLAHMVREEMEMLADESKT